jgi:hypothetical protein
MNPLQVTNAKDKFIVKAVKISDQQLTDAFGPMQMEDLKEQTNAVFQEGLLDTKASRYVQGTNAACL